MKCKVCIVIVLLLLFLAGCASAPAETPASEGTVPPSTTETAPQYPALSQEQAMIEGYVVIEDWDVRHNQQAFFTFWKAAAQGAPASVKVARYSHGDLYTVCVLYDLEFDGTSFSLTTDGETIGYSFLIAIEEDLDDSQEPYDRALRYILTNGTASDENAVVIYQDLIAEPDYTGVAEISLHLKEGDPAVKRFSGQDAENILAFLSSAAYITTPPSEYLYGAKLIMVNSNGNELIIELDLTQPVFRYGMQHYRYDDMADLFSVMGISDWPEEAWDEYNIT